MTTVVETSFFGRRFLLLLLLVCSSAFTATKAQSSSNLLISEVAPSGTSNACFGEDWVEIYNGGPEDFDLTGFLLTDDRGFDSPNSEPFYFPTGFMLQANTYLLMCGGNQIVPNINGTQSTLLPFAFGIGDDDTIQLILVEPQNDGTTTVQVYSVVGPLPNNPNNDVKDVTYAWDASTGLYNYTSTPTPGAANVITPIPTKEEVANEKKIQLAAQNDAGIEFFNFDRQGMSVTNGMDPILDLKITMDAADWDDIQRNPQYMEYKPFQMATITTEDGVELLALNDPGRIRTRGHEATYMAACLESPLPFRIDFDSTNDEQTLFGVQRIYLRHPGVYDHSYTREWAYPRMLARFGLPHVRTRMVNFYINEELLGIYTLMEIPEEEYVFARNFPDYNPNNFALFQTTPLTEGCGQYTQDQLDTARNRIDEFSTPPYAFERGEHNTRITQLGPDKQEECQAAYQNYHDDVLMEDVVLAYVRHDEVCSEVFLEEGLSDQELGTNNWDKEIKDFIQKYMAFQRCDPNCANSNLPQEVDLENFLKMFAFYAVVLNIDSPISKTNNYYLAQQSNQDKKWKLMAFDFDKPGAAGCNDNICDARLIHWAIDRPTCESLEGNSLVGPLLTDATLRTEYLVYVQEFLDNVYTDAAFIEEIQNQINAVADAVGTTSFDSELSPDAATWDSGNFPLLPTMKSRAEDVQKQLAAIEDGSYPRGGTGGSSSSAAWETCADWQRAEPDTSACEEGCKYDGCLINGWTVESFCDEATGKCYHGNEDQGCDGIADGDMYAGMDAGRFCRFAAGTPVGTSECAAVGADLETETDSTSSGVSWRAYIHRSIYSFQVVNALVILLL